MVSYRSDFHVPALFTLHSQHSVKRIPLEPVAEEVEGFHQTQCALNTPKLLPVDPIPLNLVSDVSHRSTIEHV